MTEREAFEIVTTFEEMEQQTPFLPLLVKDYDKLWWDYITACDTLAILPCWDSEEGESYK